MESFLSHGRKIKPTEDFEKIMGVIREVSVIKQGIKNKQIALDVHGVRHCFVLLEGDGLMIRSNDHRAMSTFSAPIIFGMTNTDQEDGFYIIRAISDISYALIPLEQFEALIHERNLWKEMASVSKWLLSTYYQYIKTMINDDNYQIACQLLKELMTEKESIRMSMTAATYIQDRTLLSRSWIMHLLSELKAGGFIAVQRGHLMQINKLPNKF